MATPADFNARRYLELNPDLVAAYGWDENQATNHWNNYGQAEGRNYGATTATAATAPSIGGLPAGFDPQRYLDLNPDLKAAYGGDLQQAINHWNNWGQAENRNYGQAGWGGQTDPHTYWANSGLPAAEIDRRIGLGYAHPETYNDYGPGSAEWNQNGGVNPSDPGWNDYKRRTEVAGQAEAARQDAASGDDGFMGLGDFGTLAMLAAGGYGLGALGGLWGAGAGAAEAGAGGLYGLELGGAGVGAADLGIGYGAAAGAGSGAMDWNLADYLSGLGDTTADLGGASGVGYGQSMATAEELAAMQAQYPDWYNAITGVTDAGSPFGAIGNTLKSIFSGAGGLTGTGTGGTDLMKLLGGLGSSALGAYASDKQTTALEDQAKRYEGYGAPYRQRLSDLYADPSSFLTSPEVKTSVDQGTNSLMRSLSMTGNPFGSGNALQQGQSYASDQLFGKLGQEKDRLAGFGGLSNYNAAAPTAATNAIGSSANTYNAIGSGLGNIFNPPQTTAQTMAEFMKAMKG